ncbi:YeeE/YedE family protein [Ectothiorhodospira mobilis]|uniref:YeeE/YedE family protein n=1 Tax=Ectothiorhodospira mobilis TaxID=195064 RepID=UPI001EE7A7CC|nr:YeeE/YedE family protein [Ectothiorhodospira mobilis]MCG5534458.1 YeeE/YedE family protein [Ectothiorhodospira mobilis]
MTFESFGTAAAAMLAGVFFLAFILGAVVQKTQFCTMGAVSDWVNMGDLGRMRAWLLAIAVAMLGVALLEPLGLIQADGAFPPYRAPSLAWVEHVLGGFLFGIGMTLASGCGNKTLVRIGGGNLKSLVVLLVIAVVAYFMINPFPGTAHTLYSLFFHPWTSPLAIDLGRSQDLGSLLAGSEYGPWARTAIGLLLGVGLLVWLLRHREFRRNRDHVLGGLVVGLAVVGAWVVTSIVTIDDGFGSQVPPAAYVQDWAFLADGPEGRPAEAAPWSPQSFTFINPMSQSLRYAASGFDTAVLYVGVMALAGVILGALFWALVTRGFRLEWFASGRDFAHHLLGAVLMAVGGVLGMGCTIGQGVTGISALALGGFFTFASIVFGAALTMKIQYYRMLHEDEASFPKALVTALVDMRLLPRRLRRLEAL